MTEEVRMMGISKAQTDLERLGFLCCTENDDDDDEEQINNRRNLVAVRSKCRFDLMVRNDVMIFCHELSNNQPLTISQIESDMTKLKSRIQDHYLGGYPPFGFSRGRMIIYVYYTSCKIDDPDVIARILKAPPEKEWCSCTLLAAHDNSTGISYYYKGQPPLGHVVCLEQVFEGFVQDTERVWGKYLFPELLYWSKRMTGGPAVVSSDHPPEFRYMKFSVYVIIAVYLLSIWYFFPSTAIFALFGPLILFFGTSLIAWCIEVLRNRQRKRKQQRHQQRHNHIVDETTSNSNLEEHLL